MDYALFDADTHLYDQPDAFTRYLPSKYADQAVRTETVDGVWAAFVGDRHVTFADSSYGPGGTVMRPGSLKEFLKAMKAGAGEAAYAWEPVRDEYLYREARVRLMDEQGVESAFVFPSLAVTLESFIDDVDVLYATFHAFNRWYDDEWGFNFGGRIFAPPWISLRDPDRAAEEVRYALDHGAVAVSMRTGPAYGRSPADKAFDKVWAQLNEAGAIVTYHITESGYNRDVSVLWGEEAEPAAHRQSAWQWANCYCDRPIMDTLSALIYGNVFGRFPNVRVVSVEHGAEWAPYLVKRLDKMRGMGRNGPWPGGPLTERPSEIFRRHVSVVPFPEDDIKAVVDGVGVECVLMGSDFPHAEGLERPRDFVRLLDGLSDAEVRSVMRDNGMALIGR